MNPTNLHPNAQGVDLVAQSFASRALRSLGHMADATSAIALFALMAMSFADVVGREVFNRPLPGTVELTEILMAAVVFAVMPSISRRSEHIVVDLLDVYLPRWVRPAQHVLIQLLGTLAFAVICVMLWEDAGKTARYGGTTAYFEIPMAGLLYGMSVLAAITAAGFLAGVMPPREGDAL